MSRYLFYLDVRRTAIKLYGSVPVSWACDLATWVSVFETVRGAVRA